MRFRHSQRIRSRSDFDLFRKKGAFHNAESFFVRVKKREDDNGPRLAVIVSKKVGCAVVRNSIKRIFREIFRLGQKDLSQKRDYLIVAKKGMVVDYQILKQQFYNALNLKS